MCRLCEHCLGYPAAGICPAEGAVLLGELHPHHHECAGGRQVRFTGRERFEGSITKLLRSYGKPKLRALPWDYKEMSSICAEQ
jgi:hypothetical protein